MRFGTKVELRCLVDIDIDIDAADAGTGLDLRSTCLAHKVRTVSFIGGVYVADDGYVIRFDNRTAP